MKIFKSKDTSEPGEINEYDPDSTNENEID